MKIDEAVENLEQCLSRPSGTGSIIVPEDALRSMLAEVKELKQLNHEVVQDELHWRNKAGDRLDKIEQLQARIEDLLGAYETSHASRVHADTAVLSLEAEVERLRAATRYRNTHDVRASRIDAALALHSQESFTETDEVTGKDLWESECPICKTRGTCDTVKALKGEEE